MYRRIEIRRYMNQTPLGGYLICWFGYNYMTAIGALWQNCYILNLKYTESQLD
jgi:hypothetical protein